MGSFSVKKNIKKIGRAERIAADESKKGMKLLINIIHIVLVLALLGLFGYWCYLISDIIGVISSDGQSIGNLADQITLDVAQASTIFHGMVLIFFVYFIFLFRDKINFIA